MASSEDEVARDWNAERYARNAGFVPELAGALLELLRPRSGERILDLGCGDGVLAARLAALGCEVVGVDASPDMVRAAQERGIDARVADGQALGFTAEFDAVFSNAALHWMKADPAAVVAGVKRALRPGGRFVGEMGGHGNVAAVQVALAAVLRARGRDAAAFNPWYFPTAEAYAGILAAEGFAISSIELVPRPTPLPTGMTGWLETFAAPILRALPADEREGASDQVVELLRPALCDETGRWTADYVRLRFVARLQD